MSPVSPPTWTHHHVVCVRVIDGDTAVFDIDHGFGVWSRGLRVRVRDLDTPEKRSHAGHTATEAEKEHAEEAHNVAVSLLIGRRLRLTTHKGNSFNRWLGDIEVLDGPVTGDYAEIMRGLGLTKKESYE